MATEGVKLFSGRGEIALLWGSTEIVGGEPLLVSIALEWHPCRVKAIVSSTMVSPFLHYISGGEREARDQGCVFFA